MITWFSKIDGALASRLPPLSYCRLQDFVRPLINPARRGGPRRSITAEGQCMKVSWENGQEFYFVHASRYPRYLHPNGLESIFSRMRSKYQDGPVQVRKGDVVLEVGANVGEFTCAVSPMAATVYAFEPDPHAVLALRRNAEPRRNIIVEPVALGCASGEIELYIATATADTSIIAPPAWTEKVFVPMRTVASYVSENGISQLDFLKVEAEGYEPEVLRGCAGVLESVRNVAVDCGPERLGQSTFEECEAILADARFQTWRKLGADHVLFGARTG
jgi:FkbM family methyltransferase